MLLDMHRAKDDEEWELWYTADYTYDNLKTAWSNVIARFKVRHCALIDNTQGRQLDP